MVSNKALIVILAVAVALTAFAFCVAFNVGGLGTALAGFGGPLASGLYKLFNGVPIWISSGGWPTLFAGILIFVVILPVTAAYVTWHYDLPYKIQRSTTMSPTADFTNTMKREPDEPERGAKPI